MESQPTKLDKSLKISIIIPAVFLAVFVLSGCSKEEVSLSEMQNKLNEQQAQVNELQKSKDEQQKKIEEQQATIDELEKQTETTTNEVKPIATRSAADEVYCQTNANSYTVKAYESYKEKTEDTRDHCIDKESDDCDKAVSRAKKNFEEYKVRYNTHHSKCD